jgi:hypothetical protein
MQPRSRTGARERTPTASRRDGRLACSFSRRQSVLRVERTSQPDPTARAVLEAAVVASMHRALPAMTPLPVTPATLAERQPLLGKAPSMRWPSAHPSSTRRRADAAPRDTLRALLARRPQP